MKIYLSGPIERADDFNWFQESEKIFCDYGHEVFNPMSIGCDLLIDQYGLGNINLSRDNQRVDANAQFMRLRKDPETFDQFRTIMNDMVELDMNEVRKCDVVLVNLTAIPSGGSAGEITLAKHLGIPVIGFCEVDPCLVSGWMVSCCTVLFVGPKAFSEAAITVLTYQDLDYTPSMRMDSEDIED